MERKKSIRMSIKNSPDFLSFAEIAAYIWDAARHEVKKELVLTSKPPMFVSTADLTWRQLLPTQQARIRIEMKSCIHFETLCRIRDSVLEDDTGKLTIGYGHSETG